MTPLVQDYFGYPGMSLGQLGIRDSEDLGFDSPGVGLLGISRDVLGLLGIRDLEDLGFDSPSVGLLGISRDVHRTTWDQGPNGCGI